jgi:hypothetical protein
MLLLLWALALNIAASIRDLNRPALTVGIATRRQRRRLSQQESALSFLNSAFTIGALLLLLPLTLVQLQLTSQRLGLHGVDVSLLSLLPIIYVCLGLLLFGEARLFILMAEWRQERARVAPKMTRRWAAWGASFIAVIAVLALLLPAASTEIGFYLFAWLSYALSELTRVVVSVIALILWIVLLPFWLILSIGEHTPAPRPSISRSPPPPPPGVVSHTPAWLTYVRVTVFWTVIVLALAMLLGHYLRSRRGIGFGTLSRWLRAVWLSLWAWLRRGTDSSRKLRALLGAIRASGRTGPIPQHRIKLPSSPRQRIRRLYMAFLERARRAGHPRSPTWSPYEYAHRLGPQLPEEHEALEQATEVFVQARYSARDVPQQQVTLLRSLLARLRRVLPLG